MVKESRLPYFFFLALSIYYLGTNYTWISFNSFVLPIQVQSFASPEAKSLIVGMIAGPAIGVGLLVNILSGILSDNSRSKWGRRSPYILIGSVIAAIGVVLTLFFPVAMLSTWISFLVVQIFTNLSCGSYQPLLADMVSENQRGIAGGFQGMMILIGAALGYALTGMLAAQGKMHLALILIAALLIITTSITILAIRPLDKMTREVKVSGVSAALWEAFHYRSGIPDFSALVLANFLIMLGSTNLMFFGLYYFESILRVPNPPEAMAITGIIILLTSAISAVLFGFLSDKVGRKRVIAWASALAAVINLVFPAITNFEILLAVASVYAINIGVFNSVTIALASDLVPKEESGKYMGYFNLSIGVANAVAPILGGIVLFIFGGSQSKVGFYAFFILSSIFFSIGTALVSRLRK